jgi:hypothetical protein
MPSNAETSPEGGEVIETALLYDELHQLFIQHEAVIIYRSRMQALLSGVVELPPEMSGEVPDEVMIVNDTHDGQAVYTVHFWGGDESGDEQIAGMRISADGAQYEMAGAPRINLEEIRALRFIVQHTRIDNVDARESKALIDDFFRAIDND